MEHALATGLAMACMAWIAMAWTAMAWTAMTWTAMAWTAMAWTAMAWTAMACMAWTAMAWTALAWTAMEASQPPHLSSLFIHVREKWHKVHTALFSTGPSEDLTPVRQARTPDNKRTLESANLVSVVPKEDRPRIRRPIQERI